MTLRHSSSSTMWPVAPLTERCWSLPFRDRYLDSDKSLKNGPGMSPRPDLRCSPCKHNVKGLTLVPTNPFLSLTFNYSLCSTIQRDANIHDLKQKKTDQ